MILRFQRTSTTRQFYRLRRKGGGLTPGETIKSPDIHNCHLHDVALDNGTKFSFMEMRSYKTKSGGRGKAESNDLEL